MTESVGNREQNADDQICEHLEGYWVEINGNGHGYILNNFCPKCGEKL